MHIPYNVAYQANFVLNDGKRPTSRVLYEADSVDVPEVSGTDAPVVASWKSTENTNYPDDFLVRTFDGRFFQPIWQGWPYKDKPADPKEAFTLYLAPKDKAAAMPAASKISYSLGDTRAVNVAAKREVADGLLMVDGQPYRKCAQPRMMLEIRYDSHVVTIRTDAYKYDSMGAVKGIDTHIIAPLMHEARLLDIAAQRPGRVWNRITDLDILMPEVLDFDTRIEACARTVAQGVLDNQRDIFFWPRPVADELLDIREQYRLWRKSPDEVNVADLLDRLFALYTSYNLYNQQQLCGFLANYETVQKNLPEYDVAVPVDAARRAP
ncbi:hypothetical protein [Rhizobium sp. BK176]|uniref:hypothetical protein n=1 Tax=Rhizobium sp. BK176 TaxID=2587071 RepID=UPI002168249D|nr:hypothetical protein [Rhizobium sp. BK176]MCS4088522.1 hypothetical protein [Rhizobium sp. BK176]